MKKMKKILSLLLVFAMTFGCMSGMVSAAEMTWGTKPEDGVTEDQPFASGTGGSTNFRIPCLVSLDDGTIVAACDARWNHSSDACGLDTIVSRSTDYGKTWNYTFANYLGDNGNIFSYNSTAFIDPAIATDGETVWMIADIYPAGVAINTVPSTHNARPGHTGYDENHNLVLAKATDTVNGLSATNDRIAQPFDYHLEKIEGAADNAESYYNLIDASGNVVEGYAIDAFFNIKGNGADTNLFCGDSPYFPWPTDFLYMTSSTDGGATWSIPTLIDVKRADEQTLLVGPGRGIVTSEGRIVFTAYDFTYGDDKSCAIYSDDGGKTWTRGADVAAWSSESVVTEADGKLYLFTRHGNAYYVSSDWGETWGPQISTGLTYNSNCQVTAITYSEKIDGKTAILFAAPSSTSSRANGKIFVGLVREDTTIEWVKEFNVCEGGASYAYSCLTELANGDIGLLWENQGASIRYDSYTMDEILGYVKNITIDPEEVYTEEFAADGVVEIAQAPNEKVATVTSEYVVEDATTLLYDHASNTASSLSSFSTTANVTSKLADAELVLTQVEGNVYKAYNEATGKYAHKADKPYIYLSDNADGVANQLMFTPTEASDGTVTYKICRASDSARYTIFYFNNMDFNTNGGYTAGWAAGSYELVLLEKQETVSETDVIPGYARATEITSGNAYLISYIWSDGSVIVLDPTAASDTGAQTKLVGDTVTVAKNTVTITGVAPGKTTAVVGDITYNITVEDPTTRPDYAGNDLSTEGMKLTAGSLEPTEGSLEALLDGDSDSFYHSNWSGTRPTDADFWITIELPEVTEVSGMRYLPRQSSANGRILSYEISYSVDGETWTVAASGDWADDNTWKAARFDENVEAKYVKIFATDSKADTGGRHMTAAELRVLKAVESVEPSVPVDKTALEELVINYKYVDITAADEEAVVAYEAAIEEAEAVLADEEATQDAVDAAIVALEAAVAGLVKEAEEVEIDSAVLAANAKANSEQLPFAYDNDGGAAWAFDEEAHWWHSRYQNWDQKGEHEVGSQAGDGKPTPENPIWIQTGFGEAKEVSKITYLPRQNGHGVIRDYTVSVAVLEDAAAVPSDDDFTVVKEGTLEPTKERQTIAFDEAATATHVRITVTSTYKQGDGADVDGDGHVAAQNIKIYALEGGSAVKADKTALKALVDACAELDMSVYTEESAAALAAAVEAAQAVLDNEAATPADVYVAVEALEAAKAALEEIPTTPVVDPADDSRDVPVEMYKATAGSTQPGGSPNQALDSDPNSFWEVAWDIGNTNPEVMWYQIELADEVEIDAVRYLPRWGESAGSTNGFVTQYLIQVSTDGENWTTVAEGNWERTEGWKIAEFEAVTAKYVRMTGVGTWADVGENSNMSIAEIRVRATGEVINKGALKAAIAKAEGLAAEDYVDLNGIAAPLAAAKAVAAKADATQEEVDEATKALNDAVAALVKIVKKDALKAAIADAKEVDQDLYTSTTAKALADAIAAGEALVKDSEATQEAVDAAAAAISKAKAALKAKATEEEKAALQEAVDAAEAMDKAGYTEESVAELDEAIAAAKAVLDDADATSKDVKDAADDLQDAVDALEIPVVEDEVVRLFGQGRYDTAYAVANELKEVLGVEKFEAVVVATGKNFADALAGSYLAVEKDAPILLTNGKDDNVAELHAYIAANVAEGGKVYILGGEAAVPAAVEAVEGYEVERLFGDSRYDTNLAILEEAGISGDSVIVATGKTFADSLSASAAKLPILLVKPDGTLNDAQKAVLTGMKNIYIVGGDGAVSASYEAELKEFGTVTRVFGESRYDTSVEVAKTFCKDVDKAVVASGKNFPDGLCGGPLAAALNAPLVLTKDGVAAAAAAYVAENGIASGYVLGGDGALTDATVVEVFALESAEEIK